MASASLVCRALGGERLRVVGDQPGDSLGRAIGVSYLSRPATIVAFKLRVTMPLCLILSYSEKTSTQFSRA